MNSQRPRSGPIVFYLLITLSYTCAAPYLLTSYLPAAMQALAYYIDYLQYEPISTTTIEPPFSVSDDELNNMFNPSSMTTTKPLLAMSIGTTKKPSSWLSTTIRPPWSSSSSTKPPLEVNSSTSTSWWKPPVWWQYTTSRTTVKPSASLPPTPSHKPGLFAPIKVPLNKTLLKQREGYEIFDEIGNNTEGFDKLTLALIRDIQTEKEHDEFTNDVESLDNFLRLYDDNYGRAAFDTENTLDLWSTGTSTAGKKRVPPTKPYVEFLLIYDLLKRDAKAANLSKYEGYSEDLLNDLHALSSASAERQLYTLFKRMLDRGDVERSDVVSRIQGLMKDLANPKSATVMALRYIPPLPFLP